MVLFRRSLGEVLRAARMQRGMTLRDLSAQARVSLGYISEIERGQKEASSELLASLCQAMDLPLSVVLREVSQAVAVEELELGLSVPTAISPAHSGDGRLSHQAFRTAIQYGVSAREGSRRIQRPPGLA